jgi:hypothetical protein
MVLTEKMPVREKGPNTDEFLERYEQNLLKIYETDKIFPGMAITLASNLNLFGEPMQARVLSNIDQNRNFETENDRLIYNEFNNRKKDGTITFPTPTRTQIGEFTLLFNFIRGLRPFREAERKDVKLDEKPHPDKFNYSIPECDPEVFHTEKLGRGNVDFLYNRYPFAPYHFLWIPERKKALPQFIDDKKDEEIIESLVELVTEGGLGSVRAAYNSLGAHASVNNLHKQMFFLTKDWEPPIERHIRNKTIGEEQFYFKGARWIPKNDLVRGLLENIAEINDRYYRGDENVAYSFYVTPEGGVFFPRKNQGDHTYFLRLKDARMGKDRPKLTTGFAFYEMLGEILCPSIYAFTAFDDPKKAEQKVKGLNEALKLAA